MNGDQHQPGAPPSVASFAPAPAPAPLSSSRPSPFAPESSANFATMAAHAQPFLPSAQTPFRSAAPATQSSSSYSLAAAAATAAPIVHFADRDAAASKQSMLLSYMPLPAAASPPSLSSAVIRMLPLNTSEESIRLMLVFSKDLVNVDILPSEQNEDASFRSALLTFKTPAGAQEVKNMLDGKPNISNDANIIVDILASASPASSATRFPIDTSVSTHGSSTTASSSAASSATSTASLSRQVSRFNVTFARTQSLGKVSPPLNGGGTTAYGGGDLASPDSASAHNYQNIFSPQSPIGNHLADPHARISSKTLINDDSGADDETRELLKDSLAYAENGSLAAQRRATAPQLPISRLTGLSLNTPPHTGPPAPASQLSPYGQLALGNVTMSPTAMNGSGPPMNFAAASFRQQFPPANPADQNPPCNTLYVGNLPIDTSEEELKALFSKQRGYKRLCFRTKSNGPMCFVEFEDVSFATKALHELYGHPLHNSVKGGIRLSFSKNPLGVRSGQAPNGLPQTSGGGGAGSMGNGMLGSPSSAMGRFTTASGPPPGLSAPPGLNSVGGARLGGFGSASPSNFMAAADTGLWNNHYHSPFSTPSHNSPWGMSLYTSPPMMAGASTKPPPHMLGR